MTNGKSIEDDNDGDNIVLVEQLSKQAKANYAAGPKKYYESTSNKTTYGGSNGKVASSTPVLYDGNLKLSLKIELQPKRDVEM